MPRAPREHKVSCDGLSWPHRIRHTIRGSASLSRGSDGPGDGVYHRIRDL